MGLFSKQVVGRQERLAAAGRARAAGRYKKAIAEYREALAEQGDAPATQAKLAPLLAKVGDYPGAWGAFVAAGERYFDQGFVEKALAVYMQATVAMPWHPKTWKAAARMLLDKGCRADAYQLLLEGRSHLTKRSQRPEAVELLQVAVKLDDADFEVMLDLARLCRKLGRADEARGVLDRLAQHCEGPALRRVRREYFALGPSARTAWRWLFNKG